MKHRLDPLHLHHAAEQLGCLLATGEIGLSNAAETIATWVGDTTGVDRSGLRVRLNWAMRDRAQAQQRSRLNAATAIRWAARQLLSINAPQAEIEEAAGKANGDVLTWEELAPILADEWEKVHGPKRRYGRR